MASTYTRAYSANSPRRLVSGKGATGSPLTMNNNMQLLREFRNHANQCNEEPTALVSVSNRIIDTLNRAFKMHLEYHEDPSDIWITFIEVPATTSATSAIVHRAQPLAEAIGLKEPAVFKYELVFEWAIPEKYIRHEVHLQTLIDRGLRYSHFLGPESQYINTDEMRRKLSTGVLNSTTPESDPWEIGIYLGYFARLFGVRAPRNWIAHQIFFDCKPLQGHRKFIECGIETALVDWWLIDDDFLSDCREFEDWRDIMEELIVSDQISCYEDYIVDGMGLHDEILGGSN